MGVIVIFLYYQSNLPTGKPKSAVSSGSFSNFSVTIIDYHFLLNDFIEKTDDKIYYLHGIRLEGFISRSARNES
jgi:hypothetical protein